MVISESVIASDVVLSSKSDITRDERSTPDKRLRKAHSKYKEALKRKLKRWIASNVFRFTSLNEAARNDGFWMELFVLKTNSSKKKNTNRNPLLPPSLKKIVLALSLFLSPIKAMELEKVYNPFDTLPRDILCVFLKEDTRCFWTLLETSKSFQNALFECSKHNIITQANQLLRLAIIPDFIDHFHTAAIDLDLYYLTTEKELTDEKLGNYISHFPMARSLSMNMLFLSTQGLGQIEKLSKLEALCLSCDYHGPTKETREKAKNYKQFLSFPKDIKFTPHEMKTLFPIHTCRTMGGYFTVSKFENENEYIQEIELRRLDDVDFYIISNHLSDASDSSYYGAFDLSIHYRYAYFKSFTDPKLTYVYPPLIDDILNHNHGGVIEYFEKYYLENKTLKVHEELSVSLHTICSKGVLNFLKLPEKLYIHSLAEYKLLYPNYENYETHNPTETFTFLTGHQFLAALDTIIFVNGEYHLKNHIPKTINTKSLVIEYKKGLNNIDLFIYSHLLSIHRQKNIIVYLSTRCLYLEGWKRIFIDFFEFFKTTNYKFLTEDEKQPLLLKGTQ